MLPLFEGVAVDRLSDLLGTRRAYCTITGIEFQASRLKLEVAEFQQAMHLFSVDWLISFTSVAL